MHKADFDLEVLDWRPSAEWPTRSSRITYNYIIRVRAKSPGALLPRATSDGLIAHCA